MLTFGQIVQLCSFSVFMATGQVFFKLAAMRAPALNNLQGILSLVTNYWLWGAMALYAISTLIWISVLQSVPLSIAYPFLAFGFVVIPLVSYILFKEPLTWQYGLGIVLIMIALKLIVGGAEK